ncbi:MAG TPA: LysR family transcriptional regulator [Solirubrobacteraceae bacterium]|nr:LysR family transcriptional regulator [Solirubrobacteraceae bacterium]
MSRLRILREVAQRGSFSAAADALSYTQSAVSQQIAALEAETGVTLLERRPRGVRPTAAGELLVGHAEGIIARLQAAEADLAAIAGLRGGQLRMASFPTAGATLMPLAIARFRATYPDVELTLAEGEPEEIAPRLRAGEFDLALLFEFSDVGETPAGRQGQTGDPRTTSDSQEAGTERLTRVQLLEDPLYLALPWKHPLANKQQLRLEHLHGEAWIQTSAQSACARHVVRSCHTAGFEPNVSFESDDYQTVQGLVAAGVGVALIPQLALSSIREDIAVRALSPRTPVRQVIAAVPAAAHLSPAAAAMVEVLESSAERYEALRKRRAA